MIIMILISRPKLPLPSSLNIVSLPFCQIFYKAADAHQRRYAQRYERPAPYPRHDAEDLQRADDDGCHAAQRGSDDVDGWFHEILLVVSFSRRV